MGLALRLPNPIWPCGGGVLWWQVKHAAASHLQNLGGKLAQRLLNPLRWDGGMARMGLK